MHWCKEGNMLLCKDCVNFLMHTSYICHCDYDNWNDVVFKDALLNCAEMFECDNFEPITKNKIESTWIQEYM